MMLVKVFFPPKVTTECLIKSLPLLNKNGLGNIMPRSSAHIFGKLKHVAKLDKNIFNYNIPSE